MSAPPKRLVVFAKEPAAGRVKTRLARETGEAAAVGLYEAFLDDLAAALPSPVEWEGVVAHAEPLPGPGLTTRFTAPWAFEPQGEGTLGDRLQRSFGRAREAGRVLVAVVGSDAPTLTAATVRSAFEALEGPADLALAPSPDGGYALIGARLDRDLTGLFKGVRWSSEEALEDTRRAGERLGLRVALLEEVLDVDVLADLGALRRRLEGTPGLAPRTRLHLLGGAATDPA